MAKNITIREGDTSKQFTAKKLKVNQVGGGSVNFIPEDEALDYVDVKDHTFKENGTFNPSDFNCDAFGQVKIDIPANVKEKTFTKNGTFNASADNVLGYSKVTIAVPAGGGGGPYTVRFFDSENNVIKTDANVPYDGTASCTLLDGTKKDDQYFIGWNPAPEKVRGDMNCYPVYGDYIIDPNDIQDSWETICEDGGAHYPIGSQKPLIITLYKDEYAAQYNPFDGIGEGVDYIRLSNVVPGDQWNPDKYFLAPSISAHDPILNVSCHMIKVAEGEDGTHSTWISSGCVDFHPTSNYNLNLGYLDGTGVVGEVLPRYSTTGYYRKITSTDYSDSPIRYLIETILYRGLPTALKENMKYVHKTYKGVENNTLQEKTPLDKTVIAPIWALSRKELTSYITNNLSVDSSVKWDPEYSGIDYSAQYMPSYHANYPRIYLRSMGAFDNVSSWTNHFTEIRSSDNLLRVGHETNTGDTHVYVPFGFCL